MRRLAPEENAAWGRVMATVRPMRGIIPPLPLREGPGVGASAASPGAKAPVPPTATKHPAAERAVARAHPRPLPKREGSKEAATLDASWDRKLVRGAVIPDSAIDLHGHTLASAHALLDLGLDRAIRRGDRVLLLVTGKPPRPESERPHARGAIRAAVADWLAASRFADRIAAVRGAHPRHGGQGALYIVLRRPRGG